MYYLSYRGDAGVAGIKGGTGEKGEPGSTGSTGPTGAKGEKRIHDNNLREREREREVDRQRKTGRQTYIQTDFFNAVKVLLVLNEQHQRKGEPDSTESRAHLPKAL